MKKYRFILTFFIISISLLVSCSQITINGDSNYKFNIDKDESNLKTDSSLSVFENIEYSEEVIQNITKEYTIMGEAEVSVEQAESFLHKINLNAPYLALIYKEEAEIENVRWDVAFAQSILETGYFRFNNEVKIHQNNFAGLGALGNGVSGLSFATPRIGIRAQIQHLKAYGSKEPLNGENVDVRFKYVTRGSAIYVKDLSKKWAQDENYGAKIIKILEQMKQHWFIL